jgi:hypothetical protein
MSALVMLAASNWNDSQSSGWTDADGVDRAARPVMKLPTLVGSEPMKVYS